MADAGIVVFLFIAFVFGFYAGFCVCLFLEESE